MDDTCTHRGVTFKTFVKEGKWGVAMMLDGGTFKRLAIIGGDLPSENEAVKEAHKYIDAFLAVLTETDMA